MKIILTVIITLVAIILVLFLFIESGSYDISQLAPHNKLTLWIINTTTDHSIEKRSKDITVPDLSDTSKRTDGFAHYDKMCAGCHAAPGDDQKAGEKKWYPAPPKLYEYKGGPEPAETFWIIKNGIKLTAMPAYGPTHSDDDIWAITAFVTYELPKMSPEDYNNWKMKYTSLEKE